MHTKELITYLNLEGYNTEKTTISSCSLGNIDIIKAIKGKVFKTRLFVFVLNSFNQEYINELIEFVKNTNKKNELCVVLCNTTEKSDSKTMYMSDNGDGVCIIHFVYYNTLSNSYIYNLDFAYDKSKNVKKLISYLVNTGDGAFG